MAANYNYARWAVCSGLRLFLLAAAYLGFVGCSTHPPAIPTVDLDLDNAVAALLDEHDENADGSLSSGELDGLPAIKGRLERYDSDGDGAISSTELHENLARIFDGKISLLSASCRVTRNGQPLAGAIVYYVPIPLLEKLMPIAGGVTAASGVAEISIRKEDLPKNAPPVSGLIRPGLYFVEVTHPSIKIPEIYNSKTTLGQEVTTETSNGGPTHLALKF